MGNKTPTPAPARPAPSAPSEPVKVVKPSQPVTMPHNPLIEERPLDAAIAGKELLELYASYSAHRPPTGSSQSCGYLVLVTDSTVLLVPPPLVRTDLAVFLKVVWASASAVDLPRSIIAAHALPVRVAPKPALPTYKVIEDHDTAPEVVAAWFARTKQAYAAARNPRRARSKSPRPTPPSPAPPPSPAAPSMLFSPAAGGPLSPAPLATPSPDHDVTPPGLRADITLRALSRGNYEEDEGLASVLTASAFVTTPLSSPKMDEEQRRKMQEELAHAERVRAAELHRKLEEQRVVSVQKKAAEDELRRKRELQEQEQARITAPERQRLEQEVQAKKEEDRQAALRKQQDEERAALKREAEERIAHEAAEKAKREEEKLAADRKKEIMAAAALQKQQEAAAKAKQEEAERLAKLQKQEEARRALLTRQAEEAAAAAEARQKHDEQEQLRRDEEACIAQVEQERLRLVVIQAEEARKKEEERVAREKKQEEDRLAALKAEGARLKKAEEERLVALQSQQAEEAERKKEEHKRLAALERQRLEQEARAKKEEDYRQVALQKQQEEDALWKQKEKEELERAATAKAKQEQEFHQALLKQQEKAEAIAAAAQAKRNADEEESRTAQAKQEEEVRQAHLRQVAAAEKAALAVAAQKAREEDEREEQARQRDLAAAAATPTTHDVQLPPALPSGAPSLPVTPVKTTPALGLASTPSYAQAPPVLPSTPASMPSTPVTSSTPYTSAETPSTPYGISVVGSRCTVQRFGLGTIGFAGATQFQSGTWVGIALDNPRTVSNQYSPYSAISVGKNDGSVHGVRYFACLPLHGVFVRPAQIVLAAEDAPRTPAQAPATPATVATHAVPMTIAAPVPAAEFEAKAEQGRKEEEAMRRALEAKKQEEERLAAQRKWEEEMIRKKQDEEAEAKRHAEEEKRLEAVAAEAEAKRKQLEIEEEAVRIAAAEAAARVRHEEVVKLRKEQVAAGAGTSAPTDTKLEVLVEGDKKGEIEPAAAARPKLERNHSTAIWNRQAKVLYDYVARSDLELDMQVDDIVTVLKKDGDWWEGELNGRRGAFPGNYVKLLPPQRLSIRTPTSTSILRLQMTTGLLPSFAEKRTDEEATAPAVVTQPTPPETHAHAVEVKMPDTLVEVKVTSAEEPSPSVKSAPVSAEPSPRDVDTVFVSPRLDDEAEEGSTAKKEDRDLPEPDEPPTSAKGKMLRRATRRPNLKAGAQAVPTAEQLTHNEKMKEALQRRRSSKTMTEKDVKTLASSDPTPTPAALTSPKMPKRVSLNRKVTSTNLTTAAEDGAEKEEKASNLKMKEMLARRRNSRQEAQEIVMPKPGVSIDVLQQFVSDIKAEREVSDQTEAEAPPKTKKGDSSDSGSSSDDEAEKNKEVQMEVATVENSPAPTTAGAGGVQRGKMQHVNLLRPRWPASVVRRLPSRKALMPSAALPSVGVGNERQDGEVVELEQPRLGSRRAPAGGAVMLPAFDPTRVVVRKSAHM